MVILAWNYHMDKLRVDSPAHPQTDTGNYNTQRPKLDLGRNVLIKINSEMIKLRGEYEVICGQIKPLHGVRNRNATDWIKKIHTIIAIPKIKNSLSYHLSSTIKMLTDNMIYLYCTGSHWFFYAIVSKQYWIYCGVWEQQNHITPYLTHLPLNKMAAISQTTFTDAFS